MKQIFLINNNSPSLFLLFGGWGSEKNLFSGYSVADGFDLMLCYDYRDMDFDASLLDRYDSIVPVAWSMGVICYYRTAMKFRTEAWEPCIAIGGTPFPIDDIRGIPVTIFEGTLDGMSVPVLYKFRRRMCGNYLEHFMSHLPQRNIADLKEELSDICDLVKKGPDCGAEEGRLWKYAIAGRNDLIFPYNNQLNAWNGLGVKVVTADAPHYCPEIFENVLSVRY